MGVTYDFKFILKLEYSPYCKFMVAVQRYCDVIKGKSFKHFVISLYR